MIKKRIIFKNTKIKISYNTNIILLCCTKKLSYELVRFDEKENYDNDIHWY